MKNKNKRNFLLDKKLLNLYIQIKLHKKIKKGLQVLHLNHNKSKKNNRLNKLNKQQLINQLKNKKVREIQHKKLHFNHLFPKHKKINKKLFNKKKIPILSSFQNLKKLRIFQLLIGWIHYIALLQCFWIKKYMFIKSIMHQKNK